MRGLPADLGDMEPEELRRWGHAAVDWVADYLSDVGDYPVVSQVAPGEMRARLPSVPPAGGEAMQRILNDLDTVVLPGVTHWNHPRFFAYFAITGSGPGIIGELVTAALNVNGMLWRTSPVATELEQATLDWLRQLLGLPHVFAGVIMDSASMATLVALAAAREQAGFEVRDRGLPGRPEMPRLRVYASEEAHSSMEKAAITLGLGRQGVRRIPTDAVFSMDPAALAQAVDEDIAEGWRPLAVVATIGTTSTTSIDPVPVIADICTAQGLWLHVDGAYGGMAAVVPELRWVLEGVDRADSVVVNPHKWLFTPIDCSALYLRDPAALKRTFQVVPDYLRTEEDDVEDYMHWGVQLGRRFRALKLWMVV
ncbi:MAG: pyridoxal-dependent decarboxylase, partial [Actinomycetota bacterium]|nr:pyridoxal-dependent decarboxylase [Actinomycetota bacterium]